MRARLCAETIVGERERKIRTKNRKHVNVSDNGASCCYGPVKEKKGSGDTFNKGKTKVWQPSPPCHLQAQAIIYSTYAAKHWTETKKGLENVPECWSPVPC